MRELKYQIQDPRGLHVLPLGALVKMLCSCASQVEFRCAEGSFNGKDLPAMLHLALRRGDKFSIRFNGSDEEQSCAKAANFLHLLL